MKSFEMDKEEIKQAAISFKRALLNWKSEENIRESSKTRHPDWDEEDIVKCIKYESNILKPILEAFEPLYRLAIREEINQPFGFYNYYVARTMSDHLGWPETLHPYWRFLSSIEGGLTEDELSEIPYYTEKQLPEKYELIVEEITREGWTHTTDY